MSKKTVTVSVQIQMDVEDNDNVLGQVQDVLEAVNEAISTSGIEAQPQVFISDISHSDIIDSNVENYFGEDEF